MMLIRSFYKRLMMVLALCLAALDICPVLASMTKPFSFPLIYQAEDADRFGKVRIASGVDGYTGEGYLEGFEGPGDRCEFWVEVPEDGFYDLNFISAGVGGYKENNVFLDDTAMGTVATAGASFEDAVLSRVYIEQGVHTVALQAYWGWILLDALHIDVSEPMDSGIFDVSADLVNPDASEEARRLMSYLADSYGQVILSGQYCDKGLQAQECGVIYLATGKYPAVLGLDMMDYSLSRVARGASSSAVEHALRCDELGGIVTLCWHWNAPDPYLKPGGTWYRGFYTDETTINLKRIMDGEDSEGYDRLMADIDAIAVQLTRLRDAGVPVLWRPLHEASGGWFWWGARGAQAYQELWIALYERLTVKHGLNNLIWVWNGQAADWYPGDAYVDIIGEDIYPGEKVYASQINRFLSAVRYTDPPKMVVLSENSCLVDPDLALRDGAMWGFFTTWGGEFVIKSNILKLSDQYTEWEMVEKVYHHERVITLDKLPDLKQYPLRDGQ